MRPSRKKEGRKEKKVCFVLHGNYVEFSSGNYKVLLTMFIAPSILERREVTVTRPPHLPMSSVVATVPEVFTPGSLCVGGGLTFFFMSSPCSQASGILKGFDPLLNLVLDGTIEYMRGEPAEVVTGQC